MATVALSGIITPTNVVTATSTTTLTNKTLTGAVMNGTLGATTPSTVVATTVQASTTMGVGGATPSASGAGITFPAIASDSTSANTLDDYEEGTWTPGVNTLTNLTGTPGYTVPTYTKIGNKCFFGGVVTGLSVTTPSVATGFIINYPFTANNAYAISGTCSPNNGGPMGILTANSTTDGLFYWSTSSYLGSGSNPFIVGVWITTA